MVSFSSISKFSHFQNIPKQYYVQLGERMLLFIPWYLKKETQLYYKC